MIDRAELERRRFARVLGIDGAIGSGLPVGDRLDDVDGRDPLRSDRPSEGD